MKIRYLLVLLIPCFLYCRVVAQNDSTFKKEPYQFTVLKKLPASPVKNQSKSNTCWSHATLSFLESELIRTSKGIFNLSEMFIVWHNYHLRAIDFVRFHGTKGFSGGAESWDALNVIEKYGMVPEEIYNGLNYGTKTHIHSELDTVLKAYIYAVAANKNEVLSNSWLNGFDQILNAYLGPTPNNFVINGKNYTPKSYAEELGLKPQNYISIGSFTHHPYYQEFIFEGPDNWSLGTNFNVPLDELVQIIDYSIDKGYTVGWVSDISEKGFSFYNGLAIVPEFDPTILTPQQLEIYYQATPEQQEELIANFNYIIKEKEITSEIRQQSFDKFQTTEDHMMHITGIAKDQNGKKYYIVKNSWGDGNIYSGYFYASVNYVKYKTLSVLVNKESVPTEIIKKLNIKQ